MKRALQDTMNSYRSAPRLRLNIVSVDDTCSVAPCKKDNFSSIHLVFVVFSLPALQLMTQTQIGILMYASPCPQMITFPLNFPLILIIQMPFFRCLDPKLHLFVPLSEL